MTDAITLLKDDHQEIRRLFREFKAAGDGAAKTKGKLAEQIIELLTVHTYVENEVMYPEVKALLPDLEEDILESFEEHHVADIVSAELAAMDPADERFDAKATVLIENVTHHMDEEESGWFPKVRAELGRNQLREIGERIAAARREAPKSPARPTAIKKAIDALTG